MVKKKETPKLTTDEYWQWRTTISEMNEAIEKYKNTELEAKVLGLNVELTQCKLKLHLASVVRTARDNSESFKKEYHDYKAALEKRLGISLSGKVIDDYNFEVRDLPTNNLGEK